MKIKIITEILIKEEYFNKIKLVRMFICAYVCESERLLRKRLQFNFYLNHKRTIQLSFESLFFQITKKVISKTLRVLFYYDAN